MTEDICNMAIANIVTDRNKEAMSLVSVSQKKLIGMLKTVADENNRAAIDELSKRQWQAIREFNEINNSILEAFSCQS